MNAVNQSQPSDGTFRKILVDTSLLIETQKATVESERVRSTLRQYPFKGASTYSMLEIKRAWAQRLGYLHSLCRRPDIQNVMDLIDKINILHSHPLNRRRVSTCLSAMSRFLRDDGPEIRTDRIGLIRLRAHFKNAVLSLREAIAEFVSGEFDGTECKRAAELPCERSDGTLDVSISRCRPNKIQCSVHHFFERHRRAFQALAAYVDDAKGASGELRTMRDHIRKAESDSAHLCDERHCCKLADMIIALDGRDMDAYAANNDREWEPIAKLMKKPLINPIRATASGGRQVLL